MRSKWNFLIVLIYMVFSGTVLTYMAVNMGGPCLLSRCVTLEVQFKDAAGLLKTDDVRMAGVKAGYVNRINVDKNVANVEIKVLDKFLPLYRDAHAAVRPVNLLGVTYVELDQGHPAMGEMADGDQIPLTNTLTPVQVDDVLNALDADTRDKLQIVVNVLGEATAQRGQDLNLSAADFRRIAADLAVTSTSLNQEKTNLDALLVQLDLMQKTAADYHDQLAQVLSDWNDTSKTVMEHDVQLSNALSHLGNVLGDLDVAVTPNTPALAGAVQSLDTTITNANNFLGVGSQLVDIVSAPRPGGGAPIQDSINLLPRLAQVMLGANRCDTHIYANGYRNIPGVTEAAGCPKSDGSLKGETFTLHPAPNAVSKDRHLWRVMGMIDVGTPTELQCGLFSPGVMPATSSVCSPGDNGLTPYTANGGAPPAPAASSPARGSSGFNLGGLFDSLWSDLWGSAHA